jgi:starch synthase
MNILLASSEVHPYSKTGGLADMVGSMGKALARRGHEVGLVTPLYSGMTERFPDLQPLDGELDLRLGSRRVRGGIRRLQPAERLTVYFIDQPEFYQRPALYQEAGVDYSDNAERFIFLSKAVAQLARQLPGPVEIVHVHDWQVGLVPLLLLREGRSATGHPPPRVCMTIHNLAYQGLFPADRFPLTNLSWKDFNAEGVEFYGQLNCLKGGIGFADVVTTVSPRYAREIMTEELGCGLDGLLRRRGRELVGILNGVDYDEWNTTSNPFLPSVYSREDLGGKAACKRALQEELGLPVDANVPLFGSICRLVEQKGVDIQLGALEEMLGSGLQFVLLGAGAPWFEQAYRDLAARYPLNVAVRIGYAQALSHRIEAACDFFLMPSRFEPCGLNQMYSLRYGTVPIVRATGGLDDTVTDIAEDGERANGIKFIDYSSRALAKAVRKALALYAEPELLRRYRFNGMTADFSWDRTTRHYQELYERLISG